MSKSLTAEVVAGLKATHGDALYSVECDEGTIVFKAPARPQFDEFVNGNARPKTQADAAANLVVACTVWPSVGELHAMLDRLPALTELISGELEELAGAATVLKPVSLETLQPEELAEAGVSPEQAKTWQAQYSRKGQLAAFRTPYGLLVFKRPSRASYNELNRRTRELDNIAEAFGNICIDSAVWPDSTGLSRIFGLAPGLPTILTPHLRKMAGAELEVRRKKI